MKRFKGGVTRALGGSSKGVVFSLSGEQRLGSTDGGSNAQKSFNRCHDIVAGEEISKF